MYQIRSENSIAIKVENLSKLYQLGEVGTGTLSRDIERWWARTRGKEDPFAKIGQVNDRTIKSESEFVWALKDIDFEVKKGEVLGIIGRNGAGKSTLLKILSKITSPTTGKIYLDGRIASLLEVGTGFHPEMTGRENIFMNGAILGMRKKEIQQKFDAIVDFAGVEKYIDTPVKRYSSGMYVRLAFAVAAFLEPDILIVDEVLAVGDAAFQKKCLGRMKDVSVNDGRTVLFVSHNMSAVKNLCTHGLLMNKGRIELTGLIDQAIEKYQSTGATNDEVYLENKYITYLSVKQFNDEISINCTLNCDYNFKDPIFGFVVSDYQGNKLFGSNPYIQQQNGLNFEQGYNQIKVVIKQPKLLNGSYNLSIWLSEKTYGNLLHLDNILSFDISGMTKYHKEVSASSVGPVSPYVEWTYS